MVNHEPAAEFALLRMAPSPYPLHLLDGGDVSPAFYEGFRQLGRGTIPIEGPDVPGAYP